MKSNDGPAKSQRPFGRVPVDLLPAISKLRHLDAHVFLVGCILGNRFQGELGLVPANKRKLAALCGCSRHKLDGALARLKELGLVSLQSNGLMFMTHYLDSPVDSLLVPSGDTVSPQGTKRSPEGTSSVPTGDHEKPQLQLVQPNGAPLYVYNNGGEKRQRKIPAPKVLWDPKERRATAIDAKWKAEFESHWAKELGELRLEKELEKANNWLANPANAHRRAEGSRLDQFFWKWMGRCEK